MKKQMSRREDYLKLIDELSKTGEVRGIELARELEVSKPTVCIYLKRLVENGDITMDDEHTVHLTNQGRAVAQATKAKHSILFELLQSIGVPCAIAAEDACAMEHNLSPESYEALKELVKERQLAL